MDGFFSVLAGPSESIPFGGVGTYGISVLLGGFVILTAAFYAGSHATTTTNSWERSLAIVGMNILFASVIFSPAMYRVTHALLAKAPGIQTKWATSEGNPRIAGFIGHVVVFFLCTYFFTDAAIA